MAASQVRRRGRRRRAAPGEHHRAAPLRLPPIAATARGAMAGDADTTRFSEKRCVSEARSPLIKKTTSSLRGARGRRADRLTFGVPSSRCRGATRRRTRRARPDARCCAHTPLGSTLVFCAKTTASFEVRSSRFCALRRRPVPETQMRVGRARASAPTATTRSAHYHSRFRRRSWPRRGGRPPTDTRVCPTSAVRALHGRDPRAETARPPPQVKRGDAAVRQSPRRVFGRMRRP